MKQKMEGITPQWALDRIIDAKTYRKSVLSLNSYFTPEKLTEIPPELFDLTWLEVLDISNNKIETIPDNIKRLSKLEKLQLRENQITILPVNIGILVCLKEIDLSDNRLTTLPNTFSRLVNLRSLRLINNWLRAVPECISQLSSLLELHLSANQISSVPSWLVTLPSLKELNIYNNPIENPPPEVLKLIIGQPTNLKRLQSYFRQEFESGQATLYEAKLLIVGEPGAGKTSLTQKLLNPAAPLFSGESTEGIDVHSWVFPLENSLKGSLPTKNFKVNIWDFGGQEIYHATHQFFLTRRSLYVVVADAREQKTDFFHWLDLIEHLSDRSPVLIYNNAFQNRHWAINEQQLQTHFPNTFQKPFAFNLADDIAGLDYLRQKVQENLVKLPHVGDTLPRTWVHVRRELERNDRATLTQREFFQLCYDNGFTNPEDVLQLSSYLHDLGVILHFQDDPLLKNIVILKPNWGTDAVYRVLDNQKVKDNQGQFKREDLHDLWHEVDYAQLHDELLALMMKFQLCYAIPSRSGRYIAPQLLSEQPPDYEWHNSNNLHLRYKYEAFMPKGLITRFIVAMHPFIARRNLVWRTGVILFKNDTVAEITEFYHRREVRIRVVGNNKRDLLTIITYELDKLHKPFHRLKYDKLIPCNCAICSVAEEPNFYRQDVLKTRLEHGKTVIECDIPPFSTVKIRPLLDDVGSTIQPVDLPSLLKKINRDFDDNEFRTLCLDLKITYDNLLGEGLEGKQRELLLLFRRQGRLPELINLLRQKRPKWNW